jgi:diaminopimelate epimerase
MDFHKYHALGNDYIVIDPRNTDIELTPENIRLICHRNFGIGSDGILCGPIMDGDRIGVRIYNPDGSEAEKSGNGIRIFSRYLIEAGYVSSRSFLLQTKGGEVAVELLADGADLIKVDMGRATFQSNEIPAIGPSREIVDEALDLAQGSFQVTCLSVGNPHCVVPLTKISEERAREIGPEIESHAMFPNRINVQLLEVMDRRNIRIEIWERGAGYTLASGSSSCAAACAAHRLDFVDAQVSVHMVGGIMEIEIGEDGHIHMTGPVSSVAEGNFSVEFSGRLSK